MSSEIDVNEAEREIEDYINNLANEYDVFDLESTAIVVLKDGTEYDEYSISEDYDSCDEDCESVINDIKDMEDFDHIIYYHNNTEDDTFELFYTAINLDVVIRATYDGEEVSFEELLFEDNDVRFSPFADLFRFVSNDKQPSRFVKLMSDDIFNMNFCSLDYVRTYLFTEYNTDRWGGLTICRILPKEYIRKELNIKAKHDYSICFLPSGEIFVATQITDDTDLDLDNLYDKCYKANKKKPFADFYLNILPNLIDTKDENMHLLGFITDCGQNTINFKEVFQKIAKESDLDTADITPLLYILKYNIPNYISCCEEHCNEIYKNRK